MLAPPDRQRRQAPKASGRARPELYFQWEKYSHLASEIAPLFVKHWRELALNQDSVPLDPDIDRYLAMERAGMLAVLAARQKDTGRLRGYVFGIVIPHLHYRSTGFAMVDMYWLEPEFRRGWAGVRMFRTFEEGIRKVGAKVIMVTEKLHFGDTHKHGLNTGALFRFLGYDPIEQNWSKRIG